MDLLFFSFNPDYSVVELDLALLPKQNQVQTGLSLNLLNPYRPRILNAPGAPLPAIGTSPIASGNLELLLELSIKKILKEQGIQCTRPEA